MQWFASTIGSGSRTSSVREPLALRRGERGVAHAEEPNVYYPYQAGRSATEAPAEVSPPLLNLDVRRRGFDSFVEGIAVGAVAVIVGVLLGLFLLLPI
jgi:hypothetical protein